MGDGAAEGRQRRFIFAAERQRIAPDGIVTGQIEHRHKILLILLVRAGAPGQHDPVETDAVRLRDIGMAEEIVVAGRAAAPSSRTTASSESPALS